MTAKKSSKKGKTVSAKGSKPSKVAVKEASDPKVGQTVPRARMEELAARAHKNLQAKFVGNDRGAKLLGTTVGGKVEVKAPSNASINKAERDAVGKKSGVKVEKTPKPAALFKHSEAWAPVEGRINTFDAYPLDLLDQGEFTPTGFVKFNGENYDVREFEKKREVKSSKVVSFEKTIQLEESGIEFTLIVYNE